MVNVAVAPGQASYQMHKNGDEARMSAAQEPDPLDRPPAQTIYEGVVTALKTVFDPEIPVNIYDLGLIYRIDVIDRRLIDIDMTLTAPGCPVAGELLNMAQRAVESVPAVEKVKMNLVFDPPWHRSMMSDEAKLDLGFFD